MNVCLVFPPSLCLPNQAYLSLPVLGGVLRDAGHRVRAVDLNLESAHLLLTEERVERHLDTARASIRQHRSEGRRELADAVERSIEGVSPLVRNGPEAIRILRDPVRCYDPGLFRNAFWTVSDALGFLYQLDPVFSPFGDTFVQDVRAHVRSDPWSPMRDLYEEGLLDLVLDGSPDIIGISMAFPEQAGETLRLASKLRQRDPGPHIVLGGPLLNARTERWLEGGWIFDHVDSIVLGDGAKAIVELAEALQGDRPFDRVTNLVVRTPSGEVRRNDPQPVLDVLDDLPVPDFDCLDMSRFLTPEPIYPLMISRGCYWGKCTFCSIGWRENHRSMKGDKLRADVEDLIARGARFVQVQDSSVPPRGARMLAELVQESGAELIWGGGMKFAAQFLDPHYCQTLYDGGCRSLTMGFETSNQRLLDLMDKGFQVRDVPAMLRNLRAAGISTELLWFIGFPTEERRDVLETARFLHAHRDLFGLSAFVGDYQLHADTMIFDRPEDFGMKILGQQNGYYQFELESGMQPDEVRELKEILSATNNRTLVCTASHLLHISRSGLDVSCIERPMIVPDALVEFCSPGP